MYDLAGTELLSLHAGYRVWVWKLLQLLLPLFPGSHSSGKPGLKLRSTSSSSHAGTRCFASQHLHVPNGLEVNYEAQ